MRSLVNCTRLLSDELGTNLGRDYQSSLLHDKWIYGEKQILKTSSFIVMKTKFLHYQMSKINGNLMKSRHFTPDSARKILSLHLGDSDATDSLYWSTNGKFMFKKAYWKALGLKRNSNQSFDYAWKNLWKMKIYEKWKIFVWKLIQNALSTKDNLRRMGITTDMLCPLRNHAEESLAHIFRDWTIKQRLWQACPLGVNVTWDVHIPITQQIKDWIRYLTKEEGSNSHRLILQPYSAASGYKEMKKKIFRGQSINPDIILRQVAHWVVM